jgi:hypothetical protein
LYFHTNFRIHFFSFLFPFWWYWDLKEGREKWREKVRKMEGRKEGKGREEGGRECREKRREEGRRQGREGGMPVTQCWELQKTHVSRWVCQA